jgi:hypothetical protein
MSARAAVISRTCEEQNLLCSRIGIRRSSGRRENGFNE